jgi:hypothetical protein
MLQLQEKKYGVNLDKYNERNQSDTCVAAMETLLLCASAYESAAYPWLWMPICQIGKYMR